jgi:hypothetical protein
MEHIYDYIKHLKDVLDTLAVDMIDEVIQIMHDARLQGNQVFIMGNGGSASTASHFVCDLAKNTRRPGWPHFRAIGLTDNMRSFQPMQMMKAMRMSLLNNWQISSSPAISSLAYLQAETRQTS